MRLLVLALAALAGLLLVACGGDDDDDAGDAPAPDATAAPPPVETFEVTSTADAVDADPGDGACDDGTGRCTLRAAIMKANAREGRIGITLRAGTYALSIPGGDEEFAATGDLDITSDLTLSGEGAESTIIDGGGLDRVFAVFDVASVEMHAVAIRNGLDTIETSMLSITMEKSEVGPLIGVIVVPFTYGDAGPDGNIFQYQGRAREILEEDYGALLQARALVLRCRYEHQSEGLVYGYSFWYRSTPDIADPERLRARMADHPLAEHMGSGCSQCPQTAGRGGARRLAVIFREVGDTADRRAATEGAVPAVMIVEVPPAVEGSGACGVAAVGADVGPFLEQGAVEALDLAVGLGVVGPGAAVPDAGREAGAREGHAAVGRAAVGEHGMHGHTVLGEPGERAHRRRIRRGAARPVAQGPRPRGRRRLRAHRAASSRRGPHVRPGPRRRRPLEASRRGGERYRLRSAPQGAVPSGLFAERWGTP